MKIKKEVEMTEKELIKHLVDHESTTIYFSGISYDGAWLSIEPEIESKVQFEFKNTSTSGKIFTVEVEEEITEDTEVPTLVVFYENHNFRKVCRFEDNVSISDFQFHEHEVVLAYYILNDDLTMTLIWRDGKLVE